MSDFKHTFYVQIFPNIDKSSKVFELIDNFLECLRVEGVEYEFNSHVKEVFTEDEKH